MAKYYGKIGYIETVESSPGIWTDEIVEMSYYGDVIRKGKQWQQTSEGVNDNLTVNNSISIIADPYAYKHYYAMRYCWWNDIPWKITDVTVEYPRLVLNLGGVYNGQTPATS